MGGSYVPFVAWSAPAWNTNHWEAKESALFLARSYLNSGCRKFSWGPWFQIGKDQKVVVWNPSCLHLFWRCHCQDFKVATSKVPWNLIDKAVNWSAKIPSLRKKAEIRRLRSPFYSDASGKISWTGPMRRISLKLLNHQKCSSLDLELAVSSDFAHDFVTTDCQWIKKALVPLNQKWSADRKPLIKKFMLVLRPLQLVFFWVGELSEMHTRSQKSWISH